MCGYSYNLMLKKTPNHIISEQKSTPIPAAHPYMTDSLQSQDPSEDVVTLGLQNAIERADSSMREIIGSCLHVFLRLGALGHYLRSLTGLLLTNWYSR